MADIMSAVVPFMFVLAVTYGALEVSDIFKRKQVKLIISLCFAFVAMTNAIVTSFIMGVLPFAILGFIALFFLGFILNFFKEGEGEKGSRDYTLILIVFFLFLIFMTSYGLDFIGDLFPGLSMENMVTGTGLIVMAIIFYCVYKLWTKGQQSEILSVQIVYLDKLVVKDLLDRRV